MKIKNCLVGVTVISALVVVGVTYAGPQVTVNFKNNTLGTVAYVSPRNSNEVTTHTNASPKPAAEVEAGALNSYTVRANGASPITFASVRYQ